MRAYCAVLEFHLFVFALTSNQEVRVTSNDWMIVNNELGKMPNEWSPPYPNYCSDVSLIWHGAVGAVTRLQAG